MKILGLDPGPDDTAAVIFDAGKIEFAGVTSSEYLASTLPLLDYDVIACEHLQCMGMAVGKEVFETAYWIGHFRAVAQAIEKPFHRIYRNEEKMTLCGTMKAKDPNIRQALIDMLGPQWIKSEVPGRKKPKIIRSPGPTNGIHDDLWSALAVAVTFWKQQNPT